MEGAAPVRRTRRSLWVALLATAVGAASGALGGCTDALLYHLEDIPPQPNKVTFTGTVCTDNPAERQFPLRVVFLMDASAQNPTGLGGPAVSTLVLRRVQAIRDVVSILRGPDSAFSLIRFGGQSIAAPEGGFTNNTALINEAAGALTVPLPCDPTGAGCRRVGAALSMANSMITGDLLSSPKGPRARTTYVVVLVQAGPPDDYILSNQTSPGCDETCTLAKRVGDLREFVLENGAADFRFHTFDVSQLSSDAAERSTTQSLLTQMSFAGSGEYVPICRVNDDGTLSPPGCGPNSLSLIGLDIQSARNVFVRKSFLVANLSARHTNDGAIADSDHDGLADKDERAAGTDSKTWDTDGDGIGDKVERLLSTVGLDPLTFSTPPVCALIPPAADTDGDGLKDCEEVLLRLDPTLFDTDADGIPDQLEFLYGTNFLENDILVDNDFDGERNGAEIKRHTDPRSHDASARAELAYLYREDDLGIRETKFSTQPRNITGVLVEEVGPGTGVGNGTLVYLVEDRAIAWRDPSDSAIGEAVRIDGDGQYTLRTGCGGDDPNACQDMYIVVTVTEQILPPESRDELLRVSIAERQCIDFRVRNVTLVETEAADGRDRGNNDIRIYFGQVPQDRPDSFGIFRVAQYNYTYLAPDTKIPDIADQNVEPYRFVLFGD